MLAQKLTENLLPHIMFVKKPPSEWHRRFEGYVQWIVRQMTMIPNFLQDGRTKYAADQRAMLRSRGSRPAMANSAH
jgi:hypothetical protein